MPTNPFTTDVTARLYAKARPDYANLARNIIKRLTGIGELVEHAIDVGFGTGISTKAIAPLAKRITGIEPSAEMLKYAISLPKVEYLVGKAEDLPIDETSCDLICVGSALHWFDRSRFLAEASRVARQGAWLVVLDHWFAGEMEGHQDFAAWGREIYLSRFPAPHRDRSWRPPEDLGDWKHVGWERYDDPVSMTRNALTDYLLTQSNLQVVIERGDHTEEELRTWVYEELTPFFEGDERATFMFGGFVACHLLEHHS